MNKKGFTLVELMAVVIILVLIAILAFPPIINQISSSKGKVSDATKEMIYGAVETYIDHHQQTYPIVSNNTYCIKLGDVVNDGVLTAPIKDIGTGEEVNLERYVKVEIKTKNDIDYELLNDNANCS